MSKFGKVVYERQKDEDIVVVCVNNGKGIEPIKILLPHQVYESVVKKIKRDHPGCSVLCIPAKSKNFSYIYPSE